MKMSYFCGRILWTTLSRKNQYFDLYKVKKMASQEPYKYEKNGKEKIIQAQN
jgi:hypothetical protein